LAARSRTQLLEVEPDDAIRALARAQLATGDLDACPLHAGLRGEGIEAALQVAIGLVVERSVVDLGPLECAEAIVDRAVDVQRLGVRSEQLDGRQETLPLQ